MARTDALSIKQTDSDTAAKLVELYGGVVDAVKARLISSELKNRSYVQIPGAGSVEVYRMKTAVSKTYGTARSAGNGDDVKRDPITIPLNVHKEIVEEWKKNEAAAAGLPQLVGQRKLAHTLSMVTTLDTAFFAEAVSAGTEVDLSEYSTTKDKVEAIIRTVEATSNDYIEKGIDRAFLAVTLLPEYYDELEDYIATLPNPNGGGVDIETFKGVRIFKNINQTKDIVCMALESVAQPIDLTPYMEEKIPLSNDLAVETFYDFGTEAVMPDLIAYGDLSEEISA